MELLADIQNLSSEEILSDDLFLELLSDDSEIGQMRNEIALMDRAKLIGCKAKFEKMLQVFKAEKKKFEKNSKIVPIKSNLSDGITHFSGEFEDLYCGQWICSDSGIYCITVFGESYACPHPILITKILKNAETGFVKIQLAYFIRNRWNEIVIDKEIIASSSKIVCLSKYGILVNSENAKNLVRYLTDLESLNEDRITEQISTSKLGWINGNFMPYCENIVFDNEQNLKTVFDSINQIGNREKWYKSVKEIRTSDKFEPKIYLAASLASVLIEPLNALPFIVNLWGDTGKGKTVAMMLATSIWANPAEGHYMSDAKATLVASEMRLDFLNSLPLMIDDMSQVKNEYNADFSKLIYFWCSGKGKDRSNKNLGLNKSTSWKNCIITNYEYPLVTTTMQGGAVNRIIDVEMSDGYIFENGNKVVELLKKNYGFCGREFVDVIEEIGFLEVENIQKEFYQKIVDYSSMNNCEKEEKQILPMSILLTADKIATDHIFKDNIYLDFEMCVNFLKNRGEVSENERAYQFILDEIQLNRSRFISKDSDYPAGEIWGVIEDDSNIAIINGNAFARIIEKGNFSEKTFLSWAYKNNLIESDGINRYKKPKRIKGNVTRCVYLIMEKEQKAEFEQVNFNEKLPFE